MSGGTAVEQKKRTEVEVYKQQKDWLLGIVERAPLRGGVTKDQLALSTLQAIKKQPALTDPETTDMESFRIAVVEAGQMGLLPDGRRGALVKYGTEVQFQPMVWGLVELMVRAGCKKVESRVVYAKDRYEIEYGTHPRIVHVPGKGDRGEPIAAYAVVWLPSGETQFEPMTKAEIYVIRGRSKAFKKGKGPWLSDELEMWRKTPIKRLGKYVPQTEELSLALRRDDEIEYVDAIEEVSPNGDASLNDKLAQWKAANGKQKESPAKPDADEGSPGNGSPEGESVAEEEAGDDTEEEAAPTEEYLAKLCGLTLELLEWDQEKIDQQLTKYSGRLQEVRGILDEKHPKELAMASEMLAKAAQEPTVDPVAAGDLY